MLAGGHLLTTLGSLHTTVCIMQLPTCTEALCQSSVQGRVKQGKGRERGLLGACDNVSVSEVSEYRQTVYMDLSGLALHLREVARIYMDSYGSAALQTAWHSVVTNKECFAGLVN